MKETAEEKDTPGTEETAETPEEKPTEEKEPPKEETAEPAEDEGAKKLAELEQKLSKEHDQYLRMLAEYDNYRKRSAKEREGAYTDAYADALKYLIPVMDNVERAMGFAKDDAGDFSQLSEGVSMIGKQFSTALEKMGVEPYGAEGDKFDPHLHNAIMHEENPELGEGVITQVFQRGYKRGEKILREAMVKVAN